MPYKLTDPTTIASLKSYAASLERFFEREGVTRAKRQLDQASLSAYVEAHSKGANDERFAREHHRYFIWLRDSLLWTIEELLSFDHPKADRPYVHAFRGMLQVAEYSGKVGHDSVTADCATLVRNILEGVLERAR